MEGTWFVISTRFHRLVYQASVQWMCRAHLCSYQDRTDRWEFSDWHSVKMSETVVVCQIEKTLLESLKQFRFSKSKKSCAIIMKVEGQWCLLGSDLSSLFPGGEGEETDRGGGSSWGMFHWVSHGGAANPPAQICGENRPSLPSKTPKESLYLSPKNPPKSL